MMPKGRVVYYPALPMKYMKIERNGVTPELEEKLRRSIQELGLQSPIFGVTANNIVNPGPGKTRTNVLYHLRWETLPVLVWDRQGCTHLYGDDLEQEEIHSPEQAQKYFDRYHVVEADRRYFRVRKHTYWKQHWHKYP